MAGLGIDWTIMWKFFHYQFCEIYLVTGTTIRLVFTARLRPVSLYKTSTYAVVSSSVAALLNTWFPLVPIISGIILINVVGQRAAESLRISAPMVAASMGIEGFLLDTALFRLLLKEPVRRRLGGLAVVNILNATLAIILGLALAYRHMPVPIAALPR
jgi:hypothetical protein